MTLRIIVTVLLCGLLAGGLVGCGGGGEGALATVTGRVVDDGSLQAIASAVVRIGSARDTTAADGSFTLTDAPTGVQTLTVSAAGHEAHQEGVNLAGGANVLGFVYVPPNLPPGTGAVTGTLTLSDGSRVGGAVVQSATASARSRADGTGRFTLYGVTPGTPQVTFADPASGQSAWRYVPVNAGRVSDVGQVRLSAGPPPPPL
jgi:hypothetical protein